MITCPDCEGEKVMHGFGCPGFKPITLPCYRCKGEGSIPEEMLKWIEHGKNIRESRIKERVPLREAAKMRGIPASELSDIEFGRINNLDWQLESK